MPIDLLGHRNQYQDYYGDAPLEDVAKDVYKRGVAEKHPEYVDHKNYESWAKTHDIDAQIKSATPPTLAEKLRDATAHLAPKGFEDIPTSFVKGATLGYVPATKTPEDAGIIHKMATGAAGLAGMGLALWGPSKLLRPATTLMGRAGQGALLGGAYGAARKTEEGETRLENLAADAAMFGAFGGGGALVEKGLGKLMPETVGKFLEKVKLNNDAVKANKPELFKQYTPEEVKLQGKLGYVTSASLMGGAGAIEPAEDLQERLQHIVIGMGVGAGAHGAMAAMHALTGAKITPEQKAELDRLKVREDALDFIDEGLRTGKAGDKDFTLDHAMENIRLGYEKGTFNDTNIDLLKEKHPQLGEQINAFIAENALAKVDEALLASTLYTPEQISGSAKVRLDYLEGRGKSATEQEATERDFLKANMEAPETVARGYGLTLAKPEEIATSVERVSTKKAGETKPILIRKAEKTDLGRAEKSLAEIENKPGYDKVYQADGAEGKGFYYVPNRHLQSLLKVGEHEKLGNFAKGTEEHFGKILNTYKESGANLGNVHYEPGEAELDPKKDEDVQKLLSRGKTQEEIDAAKKDGTTFVVAGTHEHWKAVDPSTIEGLGLAKKYNVPQEVIDDAIAKKQRIAFTAGGGQYKLSDQGDWTEWSDITLHKNATPTDAWHEAIHGLDIQGKLNNYPGERGSEEKAYALEKAFFRGEGQLGVSAGGGGPGEPLFALREKKQPWQMSATSKEYAALSVDELDRKAFGFARGDIKSINPKDLNVKYKGDMENPIALQKKSGLSEKEWAKTIDLLKPIQISYEKGKFWIEDGHHRYMAAKILGKDLKVDEVSIKDKPHETMIKKALAEGKEVPADVLKDYPELQKGATNVKASDTTGKGALHRGDEKVGVPGEPSREDTVRAAKIDGGKVTIPYASYPESLKVKGNRWVRISDAPDNKGRTLMVQFTTDLMGKQTIDSASKYYDMIYSGARPGYDRLPDFWEIPQWMAEAARFIPDSDAYVVRDMAEAKQLLKDAGYDRIVMSAMDVSRDLIKEIAKDYKGEIHIGGPKELADKFADDKNITWHDTMASLAKASGVEHQEGVDYKHFKGAQVIPRLTMSQGCKYKCAFCDVPKELIESSQASIDQQAEAIGNLGTKLAYLNDKTFAQANNYQYLSDVFKKIKAINPGFEGFVVQTTASDFMKIPSEWLKTSGIKYVELGVESYNDFILKGLHKPHNEGIIDKAVEKLRENKINLVPNIIIGIPEETAESYARTLDFVKKNKELISHANIYSLALYEGTEIEKKLGVKEAADRDENVTAKSFHTDPEIHKKFADDIFSVMSDRLKEPTQFAIREKKPLEERVVRNNNLYKMFVDKIGSGPLDGGCWPMAKALQSVRGGDLYSIVGIFGGQNKPTANHVVLKTGDTYWDADGESTEKQLLSRWSKKEGIRNPTLRKFKEGDVPESPRDNDLVKQVADHLLVAGAPKEFRDKQIPLTHFSGKDDLKNVDPKFQGTGSAGAEKARMTDDYIPRSYWGAPGYKKEAFVSGNNQYTATVDGNAIYNLKNDPLGLIPTDQDLKQLKKYATDQQARMNLYEKNIRDAGFKGFYVPDYKAVALFEAQDVEKVPEKGIKYAVRKKDADPFYSQLSRVSDTPELPAKAQSFIPYLLKKGVKPAEMEWMGVEQWVKENQKDGKIDRDAFREFLAQNQIQMKEVEKEGEAKKYTLEEIEYLGKEMRDSGTEFHMFKVPDNVIQLPVSKYPYVKAARAHILTKEKTPTAKFSQYVLPGGENYKELLLTLPENLSQAMLDRIEDISQKEYDTEYDELNTAGQDRVRRLALAGYPEKAAGLYKSAHWDEPNVLGHVRMNDREVDGKPVLFLEELQSDWHQEGKREGYGDTVDKWKAGTKFTASQDGGHWIVKDEHGREWFAVAEGYSGFAARNRATKKAAELNERGIPAGEKTIKGTPPAPFAKNWHELLFKRMLRYAAENGYDKLAWTTGTQQADRYDLAKQLTEVRWDKIGIKTDNPTYQIGFTDKQGNSHTDYRRDYTPQDLPDVVGKELAEKIVNSDKHSGKFTGLDLRIGGEGMAVFYDKLIPGFAEKYVKQWGSKVGTTEIDTKEESGKPWAVIDATDEGGQQVLEQFSTEKEARKALDNYDGGVDVAKIPVGDISVHSVDITPAMKESVMQGQPLFAIRKKAGDTGRYLGAKILAGEEKAPALEKVRGFVPIYAAAKYLSDQSAAHGVIDYDTSTPRQNKVVEAAIVDMLEKSIKKHPESLAWYKGDLDLTREIMKQIDPGITNPQNRFRMNLALAVTSDGNRPIDNTNLAWDVYENWRDKGTFATEKTARRQDSIQGSLAMAERLGSHFENDAEFEKWLLGKKPMGEVAREVSELLDISYVDAKTLFSGELVSTAIPRAAIFGPKIGAFFGDLSGAHDNLTMDMWFMRTLGRIQGNLAIDPTHEEIEARRDTLRQALDNSPAARKVLKIEHDLFGPIWTGDYLDEIAKKVRKLSTSKDIRDSLSGIKGGDDVRNAGNARAEQMSGGLIEAPTSGEHRNWLRDRVKAAQKSLADKGITLDTSDLQAGIWIGEKELYNELGTRQVKGHYFSDGARALHDRLLGRPFGGDAEAAGRVERAGRTGPQEDTLFRIVRKSREELDKTYAIPKTLETVLANPNGFTIDLRTGEAQEKHYFVAPSKRTETVLDHPPTEQDIADFINKYLPVFESDPKAMLGGWLRQADGKHVLDVSYAEPDQNTAMYMGAHGKQDKIYHGDTDKEFDVAEGIQAMRDSGAYSEDESAKHTATRDALEKILDEDETTHFSVRKKEKDAVKLRMPGLETMTEMKQGIQSLLLPTAKSPEHLAAAIVVGKQLGTFNRDNASAATALRADEMMFTKLGVHNPDLPLAQNPGMKFASDVSQGRPMTTALKAISDRIATISARLLKGLEDAGVPLQTIRENYFPGMWEQKSIRAFNQALKEAFDQGIGKTDSDVNEWTKEQKGWVKNRVDELLKDNKGSDQSALSYLTRTPIKGKESYRKKKTFDDIMTAIEFGLRPVSPNPIELMKLKFSEMGRSLMANRAINEFESKGDIINVGNNGKPLKKSLRDGFNPGDWTKINDKYGTIWHVNEETHMLEKIGERWAKKPVADILNNYLSSSIYNNPYFGKAFKLHMGVANLLNQSQLSILSAFHAGFTTGEVTISQFGEAIKDMYGFAVSGNRSFSDVAKSVGKIPGAFIRTPMEGSKILQEWDTPTMNIPANVQIRMLPQTRAAKIAMIARAAEIAGGGFRMEQGLKTEWYDKMVQEWHGGQLLKAALRSPVAFTEMTAKPILEWLVPRQKAGVFGELAGRIIEMNPDKTLDELAPQLRQAWNRVDARLGQVQYDRLFINNTAKNAIQALIRAPGWSGGTIAEIGGSFKDTANFLKEWMKTGKAPENMPDRVAYTIALMTGVATINGLLTYMLTGEKPEGADYWAFRDGSLDEHGRPSRWVLPTYQKDIHAYMEDPGHVLMAKTHPLVSLISDVMKNKDYYGVRIRNVEDPRYQQAGDIAKYGVKQFVPFWMRGAAKEAERGGGLMKTLEKTPAKLIAPQIGIMPAASAYTTTEFEKYSQGLHEHLARTKEQFEHSQLKNKLVMGLRRGDPEATKNIYDAMTARTITRRDAMEIHKKARTEPLVASATFMSLDELATGMRKYASVEEKRLLLRPFLIKLRNKMPELSPEDRSRYLELLQTIRGEIGA